MLIKITKMFMKYGNYLFHLKKLPSLEVVMVKWFYRKENMYWLIFFKLRILCKQHRFERIVQKIYKVPREKENREDWLIRI